MKIQPGNQFFRLFSSKLENVKIKTRAHSELYINITVGIFQRQSIWQDSVSNSTGIRRASGVKKINIEKATGTCFCFGTNNPAKFYSRLTNRKHVFDPRSAVTECDFANEKCSEYIWNQLLQRHTINTGNVHFVTTISLYQVAAAF